ncbi:hypothetical protein G5I_07179 [Acromyrmex echinatior]|uniref:Uncharacterized protein n=1 Tax=Acromyrmex echinatior TaxID=103372 RepID=F4WN32_ACREC|nr:hypothetical protein G5I_07179 [Acromyrmex echinatior]
MMISRESRGCFAAGLPAIPQWYVGVIWYAAMRDNTTAAAVFADCHWGRRRDLDVKIYLKIVYVVLSGDRARDPLVPNNAR